MSKDTILEVNDLKQYYPIRGGVFQRKVGEVKAVDGVSFKMTDCNIKCNTQKIS
ncbi:hypothetical protein [Staphylococcus pettenkoferi]|uniref:hypothetical protein n=1 Tax=Staphylococcus pettenkoferi TaxID=170573 RepID=UPI000AE40943